MKQFMKGLQLYPIKTWLPYIIAAHAIWFFDLLMNISWTIIITMKFKLKLMKALVLQAITDSQKLLRKKHLIQLFFLVPTSHPVSNATYATLYSKVREVLSFT